MTTYTLPRPADSSLMIIDVQERLAAAMPPQHIQGNVTRMAKLVKAAGRMEIPVVVTEQYPKGLGPTLPAITAELGPEPRVIEKNEFDCTDCDAVADWLTAERDRRHVVLAGMEAHICVLQSAMGLKEAGYRPWVVYDAVVSRYSEDFEVGIAFLREAGVPVLTFESILFGWMRKAGTPAFKELSHLVREKDR